MNFNIRMGIPEMQELWLDLQGKYRSGKIKKKEEQLYMENKTSGAMRMYWVYGPEQKDITIIGLEPHPEDKKSGAYDRISLSDL